jgi:hypothetical protein
LGIISRFISLSLKMTGGALSAVQVAVKHNVTGLDLIARYWRFF